MCCLCQPVIQPHQKSLINNLPHVLAQAYLDYMVDVAKFLGADETLARSEMLEVLKFEMQLANISLPREERRNATR